MPAEWQPHAATWMAWPHDDEQWIGMLEPVRQEFTALVRAVAADETVDLLVADEESPPTRARGLGGSAVRQHVVPHQDLWLRDSGPIFVTRDAEVALVDWDFNGWGNKYPAQLDDEIPTHVARPAGRRHARFIPARDGRRLARSRRRRARDDDEAVSAVPRAKPGVSEVTLEAALSRFLGISRLIWLDNGLEGDHTDGHIDTLTRFANATTIVTSVCHDTSDPNHDTLAANLDVLRRAVSAGHSRFSIVELPVPTGRVEFHGERLPLTYANFYLTNRSVLVPVYGTREDAAALEILGPLFPGRDVIGLPARALITGGGAFHCVTQQQPAGRLWRAS
jgi:agmatine deiminase